MPRRWFALFALSLAAASAQQNARLDALVLKYAEAGQFMGAVRVARGGETIFSQGYGFANLEWKIPNVPESKFRVGSITKQFTAACVLLLEERGKLRVDDPLGKYIGNPPEAWKAVTIRHLLTHTSGIPSLTQFPEYPEFKLLPATMEKTLALIRSKPMQFAPGEKYAYSNSGYILLGHVVERASGARYEDFLRENILAPLGMRDTGYDANAAILPHRASGYTARGGPMRNAAHIDMTVPHAAGALYSTTGDLLRWQEALFGGRVLRPESLARMLTPSLEDYGFGVIVRSRNGRRCVEHGGGIDGFNAFMAYYPDRRVAVIVLGNLNGDAPNKLAVDLAEAALE